MIIAFPLNLHKLNELSQHIVHGIWHIWDSSFNHTRSNYIYTCSKPNLEVLVIMQYLIKLLSFTTFSLKSRISIAHFYSRGTKPLIIINCLIIPPMVLQINCSQMLDKYFDHPIGRLMSTFYISIYFRYCKTSNI